MYHTTADLSHGAVATFPLRVCRPARSPEMPPSAETKQLLFESQHGKCACCNEEIRINPTNCDNIIPISVGGTTCLSNLQLLCVTCHIVAATPRLMTSAFGAGIQGSTPSRDVPHSSHAEFWGAHEHATQTTGYPYGFGAGAGNGPGCPTLPAATELCLQQSGDLVAG